MLTAPMGALAAGALADRFGAVWAIGVVAALTFLSGTLAAAMMRETLAGRISPAHRVDTAVAGS